MSQIGLVDETEAFGTIRPEADEVLAYGAAAYEGAEPGHAAASGAVLMGLVVRDPMEEHDDPAGYQPGQRAHVLRFGVTYVQTPGGVAKGDPVHVGADGWTKGPSGAALERATFDAARAPAGAVRVRIAMEA